MPSTDCRLRSSSVARSSTMHVFRGRPPRSMRCRPLGLTGGEQADLVALLQTLTETRVDAGSAPDAGGAPGTGGASDAASSTGSCAAGGLDASPDLNGVCHPV